MTGVTVNTGTTVGISTTLPATLNSIGYAALTFVDIGEVVDIGEIALAWSLLTHQTVGRDSPNKLKDTKDIGNIPLTLGKVTSNAGQAALKAALSSSTSVAFKITIPSGDVVNFTGLVIKAGMGSLAAGAISTTMVEIAVNVDAFVELIL